MDRSGAIDRLADVLKDAGVREDWNLLERTVNELGFRLQRMGATGPWSASERAALVRLHRAHATESLHVTNAACELQAQLEHLRNNKEGWMAYALAGEPETGNTQ